MRQDKSNLQVPDEQDNKISNDTNCCPEDTNDIEHKIQKSKNYTLKTKYTRHKQYVEDTVVLTDRSLSSISSERPDVGTEFDERVTPLRSSISGATGCNSSAPR